MSDTLAVPDSGAGPMGGGSGSLPVPAGGAMRYLNCPRCGLSAALSEQWLVADHCPRCVANTRTLVNLVVSAARPASGSWPRLAAARTDGSAGV